LNLGAFWWGANNNITNMSSTEPTPTPRGAFILFEGCDRVGKSTQCSMLVEYLKKEGHTVELFRFPDRSTQIGKTIDAYLQNKANLNDRMIHLMFSLNRHECSSKIVAALNAGKTVVCDRYCFSGAAYTMAKSKDFEYDWCIMPDIGLPAPDLVLFLDMDVTQAAERSEYGGERYERIDLQKRIRENFHTIKGNTGSRADGVEWKAFDATRPIDSIHEELRAAASDVIKRAAVVPMRRLDKRMVMPPAAAPILGDRSNGHGTSTLALDVASPSSSATPTPAPALVSPVANLAKRSLMKTENDLRATKKARSVM